MRKIKILHKVLLIFNIIATIAIIHTVLLYYNIIDNSSWYREMIGNQIKFWIDSYNAVALLTSLIYIERSLFLMYTKGYFNSIATKYLKIGGIIMICVAIISIGIEFTNENTPESSRVMVETTITSMFQTIIGIGCLIISDVLHKGSELKEDNDLTI